MISMVISSYDILSFWGFDTYIPSQFNKKMVQLCVRPAFYRRSWNYLRFLFSSLREVAGIYCKDLMGEAF